MVKMTTRRNVRPPRREGAAEIAPELLTRWREARAAVAAAKAQLTVVTGQLNAAAGNAGQLTVNGAVVIERRQQRTAGRYIGVNYREDYREVPRGDV